MQRAEMTVPMLTRRRYVGHRDRVEADPCVQPLHETITLGQCQQGVDDLAIHQPEIPRAGRHLETVSGVDQRVEEACSEAFEEPFVKPVLSDGVDHLGAIAPLLQQGRNQLWRVLQVGVHRDDDLAMGRLEPCGERGLFAKIARQLDRAHAGHAGPLGQRERRGVGAAVVDDDDFPVLHAGTQQVEQARQQQVKVQRFISARQDARQRRVSGGP